MPPRYSTTTPATRRSSPQTRSTSSASCRPSTRILLLRATRARRPVTSTEPEAVRPGPGGSGRRAGELDRGPVDPEPWSVGEQFPSAPAILEGDRVAFEVDDLADEA